MKILSREEGSTKSTGKHPNPSAMPPPRASNVGRRGTRPLNESPAQKVTPGPSKKPAKLPLLTHVIALEEVEIVEFTPSPKDGVRTPTSPAEGLGESDTVILER